jgi:hypothetical protein
LMSMASTSFWISALMCAIWSGVPFIWMSPILHAAHVIGQRDQGRGHGAVRH